MTPIDEIARGDGAYRLCGKHFEDSQFMNPKIKKSLIHNAVPTIFDVPNPPKTVTPKRSLPEKRSSKSEQPQKKRKGMSYSFIKKIYRLQNPTTKIFKFIRL